MAHKLNVTEHADELFGNIVYGSDVCPFWLEGVPGGKNSRV